MKFTRSSIPTRVGPAEWFTGSVLIDPISDLADGTGVNGNIVHFGPGARTAWHTHPKGQTIYVTEGVGACQRRGGPIEILRPGDRVFFAPGEDHWHGATADRFMVHIALVEVDESGNSANWGQHVTNEEYAGAQVN